MLPIHRTPQRNANQLALQAEERLDRGLQHARQALDTAVMQQSTGRREEQRRARPTKDGLILLDLMIGVKPNQVGTPECLPEQGAAFGGVPVGEARPLREN